LEPSEIDQIMNKKSGLKGVSGVSNDMRVLERKAREGDNRCRLAIDMFVYRVRKYIGSYITVMSGCDALVFTAGIGQNQRRVRERIIQGLFSYMKKAPKILIIPTDEELMIARQTYRLMKNGSEKIITDRRVKC